PVPEPVEGRPWLLLPRFEGLDDLRHDGEQVADDAEVGDIEDRRFAVLVDRDDVLRRLHSGPVLDRTGDAEGDVQLRRHRDAGLTDLVRIRDVSGVDRGAGSADRSTERIGELLDENELLLRAEPATA